MSKNKINIYTLLFPMTYLTVRLCWRSLLSLLQSYLTAASSPTRHISYYLYNPFTQHYDTLQTSAYKFIMSLFKSSASCTEKQEHCNLITHLLKKEKKSPSRFFEETVKANYQPSESINSSTRKGHMRADNYCHTNWVW